MNDWLDNAYDVIAMTGIVAVIYVMQKAEDDMVNKIDPLLLQWVRRLGFTIMALSLCYSIWSHNWKISCISMVSSGVFSLTINALALYFRQPPNGKIRMPISHRPIRRYRIKWKSHTNDRR